MRVCGDCGATFDRKRTRRTFCHECRPSTRPLAADRHCVWCQAVLTGGRRNTCVDCPPDLRQPHGTKTAYNWHNRAGIPPCEPCRNADRRVSRGSYAAHKDVKQEYYVRKRTSPKPYRPHGSNSPRTTKSCAYCGNQFKRRSTGTSGRPVKTCSRSCGQRLRTVTNPRSPDDHRSTRRVREQAAIGLSALHRKHLLPIMAAAHYGGMCAYCGIRPANTFDHVIPLSRPGGTNEMWNLEPACKQCNSSKLHQTLLGWMTAGGWARMAA